MGQGTIEEDMLARLDVELGVEKNSVRAAIIRRTFAYAQERHRGLSTHETISQTLEAFQLSSWEYNAGIMQRFTGDLSPKSFRFLQRYV